MQDDIQKAKELIDDSIKKLVKKHWFYSRFRDPAIVEVVDNLVESATIISKLPKRLKQEKKEWKEEYDEMQIKIQRMLKGPSWGMSRDEHQATPLHKLFGEKWQGNKPDED